MKQVWYRFAQRLVDSRIVRRAAACSCLSKRKLRNLMRLARVVGWRRVPGDIVECGTFRGGSAAVLMVASERNRRAWLYDSFEGMPETGPRDGVDAGEYVGACKGSREEVEQALREAAVSSDRYTIREGLFEQTFKDRLPGTVALLHCDADWYESVILVLRTFYPLMPEGACVILDDFGWWEGCREAFYDFCSETGEKPLLERLGCDQAYWFKGRENNRC